MEGNDYGSKAIDRDQTGQGKPVLFSRFFRNLFTSQIYLLWVSENLGFWNSYVRHFQRLNLLHGSTVFLYVCEFEFKLPLDLVALASSCKPQTGKPQITPPMPVGCPMGGCLTTACACIPRALATVQGELYIYRDRTRGSTTSSGYLNLLGTIHGTHYPRNVQ